jgi:hypothetical protein
MKEYAQNTLISFELILHILGFRYILSVIGMHMKYDVSTVTHLSIEPTIH